MSVTWRWGAGLVAAVAVAAGASAAQAGQWIQVSCVNPNGSAAPSQGWSTTGGGNPSAGSSVGASCSPGHPMFAVIPGASPGGSYEMLVYTPPAGSTLSGGSFTGTLDGDGGGPSGDAVAYEPTFSYPGSVFSQCAESLPSPCYEGKGVQTGAVALPANAGGDLYVEASCSASEGTSADCNAGGPNDVVSLVQVTDAQLRLTNGSSPGGSGFTGTAAQPTVSGTPHLLFSAADPNGPGVYAISAALDGTTVYSGTPSINGGECVPVGAISGTLMFDYQQPCPQSENVDVPVPTEGVANGPHELTVTVTDAAGNSATVYDANVTIANAPPPPSSGTTTTGPAPTPSLRRLHAVLTLRWHFHHQITTVRYVTFARLPKHGEVVARCEGRGCPKVLPASVPSRSIARLVSAMRGRRFRAGDTLVISVTASAHAPEHFVIAFRAAASPQFTLIPS